MTDDKKGVRKQSSIRFPYYSMADSIDVVRAIHLRAGGEATVDQAARFLGHKTTVSGAFRLRLSAATMFGLLEGEGGRVRLTDRANAILSEHPEDSQRAKVEAFFEVPLFRKVYEQYQGRQLPPKEGLKSVLKNAGVVPTQVERSLAALDRSAEVAGLYASGRGYLVIPPIGKQTAAVHDPAGDPPPLKQEPAPTTRVTGVHPALMGLLQLLPPAGSSWQRGKQQWLDAFSATIEAVYPDSDESRETGGQATN